MRNLTIFFVIISFYTSAFAAEPQKKLTRIKYNNPGLIVDAGVGLWAWPIPMDYDNDGRLDIVANDKNARFYRNISASGKEYIFEDKGLVSDLVLAGHTTSPTSVDWNKDGEPELLIGAEDGYLYYLNPH